MSDFSKCSDLFFSILFADDTSIFLEEVKYQKIITELNMELEKNDEWLIMELINLLST